MPDEDIYLEPVIIPQVVFSMKRERLCFVGHVFVWGGRGGRESSTYLPHWMMIWWDTSDTIFATNIILIISMFTAAISKLIIILIKIIKYSE